MLHFADCGIDNPGAHSAGNDAFAVKLVADGNLTWNTFLGGSIADYAYGIDVDGNGNVYVTGPGNATWGNPVRPYTAEMDGLSASGSLHVP